MFGWLRRDPKHLIEQRRRMLDLLTDYPIYVPPHRQGRGYSPNVGNKSIDQYRRSVQEFIARGEQNLAHLKSHREERLAALREFLSKFDVAVAIDDAGLSAVSAWCPGNYGALVANMRADTTRQAFFQLAPWTGQRRGLNAVFDLGVFLGECVIARNPNLYWKYLPGMLNDNGPPTSSGYFVSGFRQMRDWLDAPGYMYTLCANDGAMLRSRDFDRNLYLNDLVGIVRDRSAR